jgi:hypothetical protein
MKKLIMVMAMLVVLSGCATVRTDFAPLRFDTTVAKSGSDILLTTGTIDRPHKEIGVIFVRGRHAGYQKIMEALKAKAQEVGANAVIKIEFGSRLFYYHRASCRGVAVSFK